LVILLEAAAVCAVTVDEARSRDDVVCAATTDIASAFLAAVAVVRSSVEVGSADDDCLADFVVEWSERGGECRSVAVCDVVDLAVIVVTSDDFSVTC